MPNYRRGSPRSELWLDLQALALWLLIIGVGGYILFPHFFQDIYTRVTDSSAQSGYLTNYNLNDPTSQYDQYNQYSSNSIGNSQAVLGQDFTGVANTVSSGTSELSSGYWLIFVVNGQFTQCSVSSEAFSFLTRLIQDDQNGGNNTLLLADNGQVQKLTVSDEMYSIINSLALIEARSSR